MQIFKKKLQFSCILDSVPYLHLHTKNEISCKSDIVLLISYMVINTVIVYWYIYQFKLIIDLLYEKDLKLLNSSLIFEGKLRILRID